MSDKMTAAEYQQMIQGKKPLNSKPKRADTGRLPPKIGSSTTQDISNVSKGLDLIILEGISDALKRNGLLPAYVDEDLNKIKLVTSGKSYLITIEET